MPSNLKVVPPGAGKSLNVLGDVVTSLVVGADTGGAYAVQQQASQPGGGPPLHRHSREDEGFFVLEGAYDFRVGDQTVRATPGTFVFGPRGIPDALKCVGDRPGRVQVIVSPPGSETFFEELHVLAKEGPPDMDKVITLAGK